MKSSNIGGQAVIEGVMMKNADTYAVAVRKPDNEIEIKIEDYNSIIKSKKLLNTPILRGVFNFVDSMILGMGTLTFSASFYAEDEEEEQKELTEKEQKKKERSESIIMTITVIISIVMAMGIFMVLPYLISSFFKKFITSDTTILLLEGVVRLVIFGGYIMLISLMKDIKRVFMYHGAEHKCINCVEHGLPLTVENVRNSSKQHKRCGTSFLLIVMVISIIFFFCVFSLFPVQSMLLKIVMRIALIPVIAGISYEFLRVAGRNDNFLVNALSKPGMMLQNMTTKEPEDDMIEVAIASTEAVFDWKQYLNENFDTDYETEGPEETK